MYQQQLSDLKIIHTGKDFALCSFLFAPRAYFTAVPFFNSVMTAADADEANAVQLSVFTFKAGKNWMTFDDLSYKDVDFTEEKKDSNAGIYFESQLPFILNGDDYEERGKKFRILTREDHIVIGKQANGAWRLMGSLLRGADFTYAYEKQIHKCAFTWQSENPCLYIHIG